MKNNIFKIVHISYKFSGSIGSAITEHFLKYNFKVFELSAMWNGIYELSEKLKKKGENLSRNMIKTKLDI